MPNRIIVLTGKATICNAALNSAVALGTRYISSIPTQSPLVLGMMGVQAGFYLLPSIALGALTALVLERDGNLTYSTLLLCKIIMILFSSLIIGLNMTFATIFYEVSSKVALVLFWLNSFINGVIAYRT